MIFWVIFQPRRGRVKGELTEHGGFEAFKSRFLLQTAKGTEPGRKQVTGKRIDGTLISKLATLQILTWEVWDSRML